MLSYIVPQSANEEKALPPRSLNLNHNLNLTTTSSSLTGTAAAAASVPTIISVTTGAITKTTNTTVTVTTTAMNSMTTTVTTITAKPAIKKSDVVVEQSSALQSSLSPMSKGIKLLNQNQQNKNGNNVEILCDKTSKLLSSERRAQIAAKNLTTTNTSSNSISVISDKNLHNDNNDTMTTITTEETITTTSKRIINDGGNDGGLNSADNSDNTATIIYNSDNNVCGANNVSGGQQSQTKKSKISKVGAKNTTLKRVSFGSSKGSMVETLIFETPTPLPEHAERVFGYPSLQAAAAAAAAATSAGTTTATNIEHMTTLPSLSSQQQQQQQQHHHHHHHRISSNNNTISNSIGTLKVSGGATTNNSCLDDSGIDLQEELERSKVRVTFFQSNKPQQVSPPDSYLFYSDNSILPSLLSGDTTTSSYLLDNCGKNILIGGSEMAAAVETTAQISYDRQISTESGWDNPFRPGGDLSREADEIVNLIKGGKPITPTGDPNQSIANGNAQTDLASRSIENGKAVVDGAIKTEASHLQSTPAQNGTKSTQSAKLTNNDAKTTTSQTQVSNQVIPGPASASHVVIQDKKKKKCDCCVLQ